MGNPGPTIRCYYNSSLWPEFDATVHHAVGRDSDFAGMNNCGRRDLGWFTLGIGEADRILERLATCPEVTIVETPDG